MKCCGVVVALLFAAVLGVGAVLELDARWTGTLVLVPDQVELKQSRLSLNAGYADLSLRKQLEWAGQHFSSLLCVVRARGERWRAEGRMAFSPQTADLLSLTRTWQGVPHPQVLWRTPPQYLRYGWVRTDLSAGTAELSIRIHHRTHHRWDVEHIGFTEAAYHDEVGGQWRLHRPCLTVASRIAFVARGIRVVRPDGGTYTDRHSLALVFDPTGARPLRLAPEAESFLTARLGDGWSLCEVFLEDAVVYFQHPYRSEVRIGLHERLGWCDLRATGYWIDRGLGFSWDEFVVRLRQITLAGGADLEVEGVLCRDDGWSIAADIRGTVGWRGWTWVVAAEWGLDGGNIEWALAGGDERVGCVKVHLRTELHDGVVSYSFDGMSVERELGAGGSFAGVLAVQRPPAPRPAWYRRAGFRRLHGTSVWEDGRWSLLWDRAMDAELAVYTATSGESLLSVTRWQLRLEAALASGVALGLTWVSDDPSTAGTRSEVEVSWSLSL